MNRTPRARSRQAIVLLIVLGMLSLFSVLIITYVVFSSQMRQAAYSNSLRRDREVESKPVMDSIIRQIVAGGGPRSATFGQDLLGDLYGVDHLLARVAHRRPTMPFDQSDQEGGINARAMLLQPLVNGIPQSTLFKFPLHVAYWHDDGVGAFGDQLRQELLPAPNSLPDHRLDDAFTGRLLTFQEGPLVGNTFRIVRSFGSVSVNDPLAGCVVIDLAEAKSSSVLIDGSSFDLFAVANSTPNALVYSSGADGRPGFQNPPGGSPTPSRHGQPYSDDTGVRVLINGAAFNGRGHNAGPKLDNGPIAGPLTRYNRNNGNLPYVIDLQFGPELLPNRRITGLIREVSEPNEPYDAADFDNWYLAWQPADHRAILPDLAARLASELGIPLSDALKAAPHIVPSFHRPEVINYLMNQPIRLNAMDPGRRFAELSGGQDDLNRLYILLRRLRAATYRPLNFEHLFVRLNEDTSLANTDPLRKLYSDLDGDGSTFDGAPHFSGSNPVPVLNEPIAANPASNFMALKERTRQLAMWLINGPWDVDNDGDGIPDSIWKDFDLPLQVVGNGSVVKPMVAALIEDLDGRINLNAAGNYAQLTHRRFSQNNPTAYSDAAGYFSANLALKVFNRGGGIGPAEINFAQLFDERYPGHPNPMNNVPPIFPGVQPITSVLQTRYGNLLQARYGGNPWNYRSNLNSGDYLIAHPGQNVGSAPPINFSDPFSRIVLQTRRDTHNPLTSPMGRPMDLFGRSLVTKEIGGSAKLHDVGAMTRPNPTLPNVALSEAVNQPYEFEIDDPIDDDKPITAAEFHSLIDRGAATALSERLVRLLGDAADSNEALSRLLTFDSRSLDVVELPGGQNVADFVMERMSSNVRGDATAANLHIRRMLAVEFRKGGKLNLNRPLNNGMARNFPQRAFPQLDNGANPPSFVDAQSRVAADYLTLDTSVDFNDLTPNELLARNLYCLMYRLVMDPEVDVNNFSGALFFPSFPYPEHWTTTAPETAFKNRFVARRLAQWAANVVDMRDTDAISTRLRYDPNPFDNNGFDLTQAAANVVWGMERPEIGLSETVAFHDRRVKRELETGPDPFDPAQPSRDEPTEDDGPYDLEMDQFRIPEATAIVEIQSLRESVVAGDSQESFPEALYDLTGGVPRLDLGRVVGTGVTRSPVWRLAVGYTANDANDQEKHKRSVLWTEDADRFVNTGEGLPPAFHYEIPNDDFDPDNPTNPATLWGGKVLGAAAITSPPGNNAVVSLYDEDLIPGGGGDSQIQLGRFVWFADLEPDTTLNVIANGASGMRRDNVYFRNSALTPNAEAKLPPGGYAVVAPRLESRLGSTERSSQGNNWAYHPSSQRLMFTTSGSGYALRYYNLAARRGSPDFYVDNQNSYRVNNVVPIIAQALPPHLAATGQNPVLTGWNTYYSSNDADERVDIGFNVSAPLPGPDYYEAPTHRINDSNQNENRRYPLVDGYRNYNDGEGLHPDYPFDERDQSPLSVHGWIGVGTYQDVAGVFLQRLADPTRPWDAVNNPYVTVDAMSIDLTVFNGEADMRQLVKSSPDGEPDRGVDPHTDPTYSELAFDTRRKIPNPELDRPMSKLVLNDPGNDPNNLQNYRRILFAQRSPLMTQHSVLRNRTETNTAAAGQRPHFRFEFHSAWDDGSPSASSESLHSGFHYDPTMLRLDKRRFDSEADPFPQTLGFVNREMGEPAARGSTYAWDQENNDFNRYVGFPIAVAYNMPTWLDRPYQSPYEIMSVPATSASQLGREFGPGTLYQITISNGGQQVHRETPTRFGYLLGFEAGIGEYRAADDADPRLSPAPTVNAGTRVGFAALTGDRAGFEQIFDLIDIGPLSFGQRRWFDPVQTGEAVWNAQNQQWQPIPRNGSATQNQMFNRAAQTLHPPFNYIEKHRTPGKVNINTTPDYIRRGAAYSGSFPYANPEYQRPLKVGTRPRVPGDTAGLMSGIASSPTNFPGAQSIFDNAVLYGNGSVWRALTSGISTAYDLDDDAGEPVTMGEYNGYHRTTDSRFGYGFKGYVQSRRGYGTTWVNFDRDWTGLHFFNTDLDYRFPSRFAGMFTPHAGSTLPSVQRYLRKGTDDHDRISMRRTHDMSLLRPHPDFDLRGMTATARAEALNPSLTSFTLGIEQPPANGVTLPGLIFAPNAAGQNDPTPQADIQRIVNLRMPLVGSGVVERPQAELHKNFRHLDRDPFFRFKNASQLSGMTTHHSNVFMVRFTIGFFHVDTATGAVGEEYVDPREGRLRPRGFYIVDRTIPVGYDSGLRTDRSSGVDPTVPVGTDPVTNALDTVIFSSMK